MDQILEQWRSVPGYGGHYEASNAGRIRSLDHRVRCSNGHTRLIKGRIMKACPNSKSYLRVPLSYENKSHFELVHRMVAKAFIKNPLSLPCVNHINGQKTDNRPENLEWITHKGNSQHALAAGLYAVGEKHQNAKHTRDDALMVLGCLKCGVPRAQIAAQLGVSPWFISSIASGTSQYLQAFKVLGV